MSLELFAFATDPLRASALRRAGIDAFVVDWEHRGKHVRQRGADTEINADTVDDLRAVAGVGAPVACRIDGPGIWTPAQVDDAVQAGATVVLLPMVRHPDEVEALLRVVDGRLPVGILVETVDAVERARALATLPLARVYVGFNDLCIDRRGTSIFEPLIDGTAERLREAFASIPVGMAGATVVDGGHPIPCRLLLAAMEDVGTDFTFLRRSFRRDVAGREVAGEVDRIAALWAELGRRDPAERTRDRAELAARIAAS